MVCLPVPPLPLKINFLQTVSREKRRACRLGEEHFTDRASYVFIHRQTRRFKFAGVPSNAI